MIIIVCVDDHMGMSFNHRRQSQDRILREKILKLINGNRLWVSPYSARQFTMEQQPYLMVDEDYLNKAAVGEYCFVEHGNLSDYENDIEQIILCRWNRIYPADCYFEISLDEETWNGRLLEEFQGSSHEKISLEVFCRKVLEF